MTAFHPHPYQTYAIRRIVDGPAVGLMLDMGLGKTVITLTAVRELIYERLDVRRALVIAPKKVAEATWQAEGAKWDHLADLRFSTVLGDAKARRAALETNADVYVINRENVVWLVENYGEHWPFDMVIVDESSSFKNPAAKRFKALRKVRGMIDRIVILTGTPAPNGIMDLWAQVWLLDRGQRLGKFVSRFREYFFTYNPWKYEYTPKPGAFAEVQRRIGDICVSMSASDWLQLPERIVHDVPVALGEASRKAYRKLEREMLLEADGETITALSAGTLTNKLLQLCGGAVYVDAPSPRPGPGDGFRAGSAGEHGPQSAAADAGRRRVVQIHTDKLEALTELVESLNGEPCLLFYGFRHEIDPIRAALGEGVRMLESAADADAWNAGKVKVLLAHPASCAYGLNLQAGGRHIIWYTLTWSLELYQQANARLYRQGQEKPVIVHRLLVQGGVDWDVAKALEGKDETQTALLEALKARIKGARI